MIIGAPRAAERLHYGVPQLDDIQAYGFELAKARNLRVAVKGMGELVQVRPDLAEMPEKPRQLFAFDWRPAHRARAGAPERERPQIGPDAEASLSCRLVDLRPFFCGAPNRDKTSSRVVDASPAPATVPRFSAEDSQPRSSRHASLRLH